MKRLKLGLMAATFVLCQWAYAQGPAVPMLEQTAHNIIDTLKQNKSSLKNNPQIIYQAVQKYLVPNVDVEGMSRSVLGRKAWTTATSSERTAFSRAFTRLVIRTYASPLAQYTSETIKFLPQRSAASGQFTRVNSIIIRPNGQNIPLSYSLVSKNGQWKIYDLSVEGVSLLQSFRNQFGQELNHSTIQELIAQMGKNKKVS